MFDHTIKKVLVIGSGPIVIGQAAEFDYAGTQACLALKEEGIEVVLVNNNPATIMTDDSIADHVYMEPLTVDSVENIIKVEQPDGLIGTLGGQTGLNLTVQLFEQGILEKHNVRLLGTSVPSIQQGEDREKFRSLMHDIKEPVPASEIVESLEEGLSFVHEAGFPVILRPAYTLGGGGGGFAYSKEELKDKLQTALEASPIHQVLVEQSIKGWKEVEYEVMRDANDTCIIVCNMENLDPVGVHTGDSIVVAPSQTLTDTQYQMLRNASLKVIRALEIVGGCNIQFALHPESEEYAIIEVNPRVSRSSALASKATGYPIARIAAKCAIGYQLDEILNPITGNTYASFEPALDYCVVKLPRFPFDKFSEADRTLGTQMKATGEVMALERTFEAAMNKAIRSLEMNRYSLMDTGFEQASEQDLFDLLENPNDRRLFAIGELLARETPLETIHELTGIDYWFIYKLQRIVAAELAIKGQKLESLTKEELLKLKRLNVSNKQIATLTGTTELNVYQALQTFDLTPSYKLVDTCAGEFDALTPYYYSTWQGFDEVEVTHDKQKLLVLGSGPIRIGQGVEFDYCSVHAALAAKASGYETIVMNNNPETVSTDYTIGDRLYFEPLTVEDVLAVATKEQVDGVIVQFGGQTAINLANELKQAGLPIIGTSADSITKLEDREAFYQLLDAHAIPHIEGTICHQKSELKQAVNELSYPVLIRPSFVIGGQSMYICHSDAELDRYLSRLEDATTKTSWPLLVDRFIPGKEVEIDVISDGKTVVVPGIFEHVEKAGVHSGDSVTILPSQTLTQAEKDRLVEIATIIAKEAQVIGMMNIQFVLHDSTVYVLEVNPRSSRTVPIMSKVTGVPMVEWAVRAQIGEVLADIAPQGLMKEPDFVTVKAPVFSATKLKGVDHAVSPEMKSTGEMIGFGETVAEAKAKVLPMLTNPTIIVSAADASKQAIKDVLSCIKASIYATPSTHQYLTDHGVQAEKVDYADIEALMKQVDIDAVLSIATAGRHHESNGFKLRELAIKNQVPLFTHEDTFTFITTDNEATITPKSIQSYRKALEV
ncbi:carbamoyl-phosphate synthase (glutamine-hydrolyzing) large subunit [Paenalkalicoccus suaedae]|uniref:Carbamoyl phosphate synthase large chain n=1 Tax=Paenalkalicoccus suaedae TaxID=2592382 RepID=A0A859FDR2_9BACI|nr:carbamoyl-phosphate synthase (glutamine-hydrolyzing) large subunit [Paenalkalicoccus suaedae]QKS71227.1 carbamoyl-phosphate synthase (glutamine-hydrolyzing) large subunit [Paenalkalicoccus suaedae]